MYLILARDKNFV